MKEVNKKGLYRKAGLLMNEGLKQDTYKWNQNGGSRYGPSTKGKKLKLRIGLDYQSPIEIPVVDNLVLVDSLDSAVGIEYRENSLGGVPA